MPHILLQYDWEEVAEGVGNDVVEEVEPGVFPDLPVTEVEEDGGFCEFVCDSVAAVALDAGEDDRGLVLVEEGTTGDH